MTLTLKFDLILENFNLACYWNQQRIHMCNIKALSLPVWKFWPRLKFFKSRYNVKWYGQGCSSVILLRPKMGVEPPKHDVISMPTQQYTNTNDISLERYHLVVSIMLRYMDQIKTFNDNLSCREVKIDKIFRVDLPYFALKCDKFL